MALGLAGYAGVAPAQQQGQQQAQTPVSTITDATFAQYRGEYVNSPLCTSEEITLWTCESGKRVFSLCSSQAASRTSGYLQYRASTAGKLVLRYPALKGPPLGSFTYNSFGNGDASVEFTNEGFQYSLIDPLRGRSLIRVAAPGPQGKQTEIACGPNQTLQVNYTMRLMFDFGVWDGH